MHNHTSFSEESPASSWSVVLERDQDELVAKIEGYSNNIPSDFAFYLMRGKDLIEKRWYSEKMSVRFSQPSLPGDYHAIGFVRTKPDLTPEFKKSAVFLKAGYPLYDLQQWKQSVFDYPSDGEWPEKELLRNGIHRFAIGAENTLDIRLDGIERLRDNGVVLVCFGGAIPKRSTKSAPFFSGIGVAGKLGVPVLSVSDPSLGLSQSLALGWYAGYKGFSDLPKRVAALLDAFADRYQSSFVIFGGSGGGFATIAVLGWLETRSTAVVWNPQISIGRYSITEVTKYLDIAFPLAERSVAATLESRLQSAGIMHDLVFDRGPYTHPLLYLQNISDRHHVEQHARPYALSFQAKRISKTVFAGEGELAFWFGDWGRGHAVPPSSMILSILDDLISGKAPKALALQLEREEGHDLQFDL